MFLTRKTINEAKEKGMKVGKNVSLPPEEKKQYLLKKFNIE